MEIITLTRPRDTNSTLFPNQNLEIASTKLISKSVLLRSNDTGEHIYSMLCLGKPELEAPIIVKRAKYKGTQITNSLKAFSNSFFFFF